MSSRKTTEQFISEARKVHGLRYDYSKVTYKDNKTKILIICPTHGEFLQSPIVHLHGCGCAKCSYKNKKLCGIGNNDIISSYESESYKYWSRMIKRCYYQDVKRGINTYDDCSVCDEWHDLSTFAKWFDEHYVHGWALDKDILVKGNRVYSPSTCCFVPQEINNLFTKRSALRGELPIGVASNNGIANPFRAYMAYDGRQKRLGVFDTKEKAFLAYKDAKQIRIKELAEKYKDKLEHCVYQALCNYKVEITD